MEELSILDICKYTKGKLIKGKEKTIIKNIVIDSREISPDTLFIPIIGERFDGHIFMESAYDNGCRNFLIDKNHQFLKEDINLIEVEDTKIALGAISKGYKNKFNIPFIAITGSVGKTSTKDIIYNVLKEKYNTLKTIGNLNNDIGLPKTLLKIDSKTEIAIVELGMDKKGEIDYLTNLVNPDIAVITNIGLSHIMNFENQEEIFKAKLEIVNGLKENGLLLVNGDDKYLHTLKDLKHNYKLITCGFNKENDIYCKDYFLEKDHIFFTCIYNNKEYKFKINSIAKHNILNALFSIVIGFKYNLTEEEIFRGLLNISFSSNRLNIIKTNKYTIIDDTYNASYDSVISALEVLETFKGRKVAILGDILELGDYSKEIHQKIGKNLKCDLLITIGNDSNYIKEEAIKKGIESYHFLTKEEFYNKIPTLLRNKDIILVKASHGIRLDEVVNYLGERTNL